MIRTAIAAVATLGALFAAPATAQAALPASGTPATAAIDTSAPGAFAVGTADVTVRANGRSLAAKVFYPATAAGSNKPVAAGEFGVIAFGHGFLQGVGKYTGTLSHLASWGFIVAAPTTNGGLSPNHSNFADDLNASLAWFQAQDSTAGSIFLNHVDGTKLAVSGHSMGGGSSVLAASRNADVKTVANLAAAETNPSAATAAASIRVPAMLVSGDSDTIAKPADNQIKIYAAKQAPKQLRTIVGGFHCGFMDSSAIFCDNGAVGRTAQLQLSRRLLTDWFLYYLNGDTSRASAVWGAEAKNDPQVKFEGVN